MVKENKELDKVILNLEKKFGEGIIIQMGQQKKLNIEMITTGSLVLDKALGGGIPKGRIIEIMGNNSSGKTTLALTILAQFQKAGYKTAFADLEHAIDLKYSERIGVNMKEMLLTQPDNLEATFEIVEALIQGAGIQLIIIDSVAALVPKAELEGDYGQVHMGLQARLMGQALRKLTGIVAKTGTTLIFINQTRAILDSFGYGPKTTTPGGNALKFYTSIRMEMTNMGKLEEQTVEGKTRIGNKTRVKVVKNKIAPPFKEAHFDIMYNKGISTSGEVLDLAVQYGIVNKKSAFYDIYGEAVQGRENSKIYLELHSEVLEKLVKEVKNFK